MPLFANRFSLLVDDAFTRITFFDNTNNPNAPGQVQSIAQAAMIMQNADASDLADCIVKTIAQQQARKEPKQ